MAQEKLEKEDFELINESLRERVDSLAEISRKGLTSTMRKIAKEEMDNTMKVWQKICSIVGK